MSILQNVSLNDIGPAGAPRRRILLLAHSDLGEPTARYLRNLGHDVTTPFLGDATAEACAAVLFPPAVSEPRLPAPRRTLQSLRRVTRTRSPVDDGPSAAFFAWSAYDSIVIQDLWFSENESRLVPFGCTLSGTDYYVRGNFDRPKAVIVTDPAFYRTGRRAGASCEEPSYTTFDPNRQIAFVPLLGSAASERALDQIGTTAGGRELRPLEVPGEGRRRNGGDTEAPEQARAVSLLSSALVRYISERARVVVIDDSLRTVLALAAQFGRSVDLEDQPLIHFCDVTTGVKGSYASFIELRGHCERLFEEARSTRQPLVFVTDILFDNVAWQGERKTGIDLISLLRSLQDATRVRTGIIGLTGLDSPLVAPAAFHRGADTIVNKSGSHKTALHHAKDVDGNVMYKLLLTVAFHCFQNEFLRARRQASPEKARSELAHLRAVLPRHAVSPHLHAEWDSTHYLLESQATYAGISSKQVERAVRQIREQYD